jgi:hypothetical protein
MAHELGHHIDLPHCDGPLSLDNTPCGGEGNVSLMHSQVAFPNFKGCILHKPEWDTANSDAANGG